ncbi:Mss4-like protein, partial [Pyrenochaeta sp. MPI-SDFR-AT-0127]
MTTNPPQNGPTRTFTASCHCRHSTLSFTVPVSRIPLPVHFCHCSACRHTHGTLCSIHTRIPRPEVNLSSFTAYESSNRVTRWFCSTCGAHMLDRALEEGETEGRWYVAVSVVDAEEEVWDFQKHIFVQSTGDGGLATLLGEIHGKQLTLWKERPNRDKEFEHTGDWIGPSTTSTSPSTNIAESAEHGGNQEKNILKARCHCNGISFSISRPRGAETWSGMDPTLLPRDRKKYFAVHDACTTCRFTSSSRIVSWFFPSRTSITIAPPWPEHIPYPDDGLFGTAKLYESSDGVRRTFCGVCGATVSYWCRERAEMVDFAVGLLEGEGQGVRREDWLEWR